MSWRFRKVLGRGPFRWTLSKRGIGWSFGIPGLRYGVSPNGSRYVSFGLPGTGLYWIKYLDQRNQPVPGQPRKPVAPILPAAPPPQKQAPEPWWRQKSL